MVFPAKRGGPVLPFSAHWAPSAYGRMLMIASAVEGETKNAARGDRRNPIARHVELLSGAYLVYSDHCTVIGVNRYAPKRRFRG